MLTLVVALGGGLGAVTRFFVDHQVGRLTQGRLPLGTALINVTGSLALGFITGWWAFHTGDPGLKQVLGTGFLGGYTTFSTACVEAVRLVQAGRWMPSMLRVLGVLVLSVVAAFLGYWLGSL